MTYLDILKDQLPEDEGFERKPYRDTVGKLTIGVGRNLDDVGLHDSEIFMMLDNDIADAEILARKYVPTFEALTDARKAVICNMAFNMGPKLAQFVKMLQAVNGGDWNGAAEEMLASAWAKQVGDRATKLANAMRMG